MASLRAMAWGTTEYWHARIAGYIDGESTPNARCDPASCTWQWTPTHAAKVCVDVDPANTTARRFYTRHGAVPLNPHWLVWNDITLALRPPERDR
jgi:hypothetical protein